MKQNKTKQKKYWLHTTLGCWEQTAYTCLWSFVCSSVYATIGVLKLSDSVSIIRTFHITDDVNCIDTAEVNLIGRSHVNRSWGFRMRLHVFTSISSVAYSKGCEKSDALFVGRIRPAPRKRKYLRHYWNVTK